MKKTKLSAPWITFSREMEALFEQDEQVKVLFSEDEMTITLLVSNYEKAEALKRLIPKKKEFGGVTVEINIKYREINTALETLIEAAFKDNPVFKYSYVYNTNTNPITYIVFEKKVVQFWNDDMGDPHGVTSTLYENIAADIFDDKHGFVYSTDSDVDKHHATPVEVAQWEKYNGEGSFNDGSPVKNEECSEKTYKILR